MQKHFVTFFSPGTFVAETTTKPIESWDVNQAVEMAKSVVERYNALPYGFRFSTRERGENDLDSHEVKTSAMCYLGGEVLALEEIKARNNPDDRILISNMECNGWQRVVINKNSWSWCQPLASGDEVLDAS